MISKLVDAVERDDYLDLALIIKAKLLQVSLTSIARMLGNTRLHIDGQRKCCKDVGSDIRISITARIDHVINAVTRRPLMQKRQLAHITAGSAIEVRPRCARFCNRLKTVPAIPY
ncbi:hypothetical protein SBC1_79590 (plasmid) [Caballeronia sp. SBC1]|uniref:hypothetical protein n=1 Tax=Caballeronia sp. SBC1 TaxID=2705548 RepID=UPI00140E8E1D|nr:hypothetical protein [Caballeronia sp. SBC1]QIN67912.1 hypothetical protein SBC1_79590 [Caballeronia sp. SBC1]